jgi:hypothetical protein
MVVHRTKKGYTMELRNFKVNFRAKVACMEKEPNSGKENF